MNAKFSVSKKSSGFTLLEVMMVIIVLCAVFFPLLQMISSGLLASNEVRGTNTAVILAQKELEEIRNTSYVNIISEAKSSVTGAPGYSLQVNVSEPLTNLKRISVIVYWFPGEGSESNVSVETFVANF